MPEIKEITTKERLSILEKKVADIENRLNPNFGKGFKRSEEKSVSLHQLNIND